MFKLPKTRILPHLPENVVYENVVKTNSYQLAKYYKNLVNQCNSNAFILLIEK